MPAWGKAKLLKHSPNPARSFSLSTRNARWPTIVTKPGLELALLPASAHTEEHGQIEVLDAEAR